MNANELADYVDAREINNPHLKEAATMLRTIPALQAEIEIVIKLLCEEQVSDDLMVYWNPLHSTLKSKLLKAQEK